MDDAEWDGLFSFDRRVLQAIVFKLPGETSVQSGVGLGVRRLSWVEEAIQEVGRRNCPPCLRKKLFPKSVHSGLGVGPCVHIPAGFRLEGGMNLGE